MNIFALDNDPILAARWHSDKHVIKMILETAQIPHHGVADEHVALLGHDDDEGLGGLWLVLYEPILTHHH